MISFCYALDMNEDMRKVIIYGDSLILEGVRARLEDCADIQVISLNQPCTMLAEVITAQRPVALIFDAAAGQPEFPAFLLQQPELLLIGIEPEMHQAWVWSGRQAAAVEAADLLGVIRNEDMSTH
jgi:hypothetical protein